jgi:hypothetical protein
MIPDGVLGFSNPLTGAGLLMGPYASAWLLMLAALGNITCGPSATPPPSPIAESSTPSSNRAHLALLHASEELRVIALRSAITMAGEACDSVTRTLHQGADEDSGKEFWNVACEDGNTYVVAVNNDAEGSTQVMSCALLKAEAQVDCFVKFWRGVLGTLMGTIPSVMSPNRVRRR